MGMISVYCPFCKIVNNVEVSTRYLHREKITNFRCLKCGKTIKIDKEAKENGQ